MYHRIGAATSETRHSLDFYDIHYFLDLYESIEHESYEGLLDHKERESLAKQQEIASKMIKRSQ